MKDSNLASHWRNSGEQRALKAQEWGQMPIPRALCLLLNASSGTDTLRRVHFGRISDTSSKSTDAISHFAHRSAGRWQRRSPEKLGAHRPLWRRTQAYGSTSPGSSLCICHCSPTCSLAFRQCRLGSQAVWHPQGGSLQRTGTCRTLSPARSILRAVHPNAAPLTALLPQCLQIPSHLLGAVDELYTNYKAALLTSGVEGATEEFVAKVMASVCERVMIELNPKAAFTFPSQHHRLLEPYNYYNFGQRYIRGLVDFKTSMLGGRDTFKTIAAQLAAGENVVLLANHQTEADPAVFALLLETEFRAWPRMCIMWLGTGW